MNHSNTPGKLAPGPKAHCQKIFKISQFKKYLAEAIKTEDKKAITLAKSALTKAKKMAKKEEKKLVKKAKLMGKFKNGKITDYTDL